MSDRPSRPLRTWVLGFATASPTTPSDDGAAPGVPDVPVTSTDLASLADRTAPEPTSLAIGSLEITLPVDPVGIEDDGQMEIPPLAERAGWYRFGAAPGQDEGTAVIAAHVDSVASAGLGPFARLGDVREGARVQVTLADGTRATYAVTEVQRVSKREVTWEDVFVRGGDHRLVLITCGGTFQQEARSYSDNVIVTAEPVGG